MPVAPASPSDNSRRAVLSATKLTALAKDRGVEFAAAPAAIGVGVAAMSGTEAWVLVDEALGRSPDRALGPSLAWALRAGAESACLLAEQGAGTLARRAVLFDWPITVWQVVDREQRVAAPAEVLTPHDDELLRSRPDLAELTRLIEAAGAMPVVEHGVLAGEVAGLEVCRVVDGPTGPALEVGIGAHDRETFQMLHGSRPTLEALRDVVAHVAVHRSVDAPQHPLNQLARSRLLRARLLADPSLVGVTGGLETAAPPVARSNVKDELPCVARATSESLVVVCSVGIDLDAVAFAADTAAMYGAEQCLLAVPARDAVELQHRLAALVRVPTRVVAVPN